MRCIFTFKWDFPEREFIMAKRLTSIRIGEITDSQIKDFIKLGYTFTQVLTTAIDRFHHQELKKEQDSCLHAPVYNQLFQQCDQESEEAIAVFSKNTTAFLQKVVFEDLNLEKDFFIEIAHLLRPPFDKVDWYEKKVDLLPRKFCKAMLVATPHLALV